MNFVFTLFYGLLLLGCLAACQVETAPPELWRLAPERAAIGADVTLTGVQFGSSPTVTFGSGTTAVTATVKRATDASIVAVVPRMPIGATLVRVTTDEGSSESIPFTVLQPTPVLASVSPTNGLPGTPVKLTGDFLDQLRAVRFGDQPATVVGTATAREVTVNVPATARRGPQTITVETEGGRQTGDFIVAGTPEITDFTPRRTRVGTELVIKGRHLTDGVVRIGGQPAPAGQASDTEIRVTIPTSATSGRISVTVFDKLVGTSADSLILVAAPTISANGLSATEGIKGEKITLTGTNLRDVTAVQFGTTPAPFRVLSPTQLELTVPDRPQPGEVTISVSSVGGTATSAQSFLLIPPPAGLTINPIRQVAGRDITISGQPLYRITAVTINGRPAVITGRTEGSSLRVTVPADATSGPITVTNRAGSATTSGLLTVVQKPVITAVTDKALPGGRVVIRGNFLLNADVFFTGSTTPAVNDGRNTDTEVWVKVPVDAQNGPLRIVNEAGETLTPAVTVTLK